MELAHWWKGYFNNAGTVVQFCRVLSIYIKLIFFNLVLTDILIPGWVFITLF